MDKFQRFALDVILADYSDKMDYEEILDYLERDHDSAEYPYVIVLEDFEDERGEQVAQRIEDMHDSAVRWFKEPETAQILWETGDVMSVAQDIEVELTNQEAKEILDRLIKNHDAMVGINWNVISDAIGDYKDQQRS